MSPVNPGPRIVAIGCMLLALLIAGCSKQHGTPFDPDSGHPSDFFSTHAAAYLASVGACATCHGDDLLGGISTVSCFSASRDGRACHPGGPGGHPAGWLALHSATAPTQASLCAACHDNPANTLAPNCFNNSLCHGAKSGHIANWLSIHSSTSTSLASSCAACHQSAPGTPGCFNNTLCHGVKNQHPANWLSSHSSTSTSLASTCAACHQSAPGTPGCFNSTLCHGPKSPHPSGWLDGNQHGVTAIAAPGGSSGMAYCGSCHGATFGGGTAESCLTCHGGNAPHPYSNWAGSSGRHRSASTGNTTVCALCHPQLAGSSNCLNTNGCHEGD